MRRGLVVTAWFRHTFSPFVCADLTASQFLPGNRAIDCREANWPGEGLRVSKGLKDQGTKWAGVAVWPVHNYS